MRTAHAAWFISASLLLAVQPAGAQVFFGNPELDFWNEGTVQRVKPAKPVYVVAPKNDDESPPPAARRLDERPFRWQDYDDPSSEPFWDDGGDYIPPRPLRVAAADPTPTNVANLLRWQQRKIDLLNALHAEAAKQLSAAGTAVPEPLPKASQSTDVADAIDWRKAQFVFFYSSTCPHCKASVSTVNELEQRGSRVIPVQTDWQQNPPLLPGSAQYTAEIAKEQPIEQVPTWIATYGDNRIVMHGEVTPQSIETTLKAAEQRTRYEQLIQPKTGG